VIEAVGSRSDVDSHAQGRRATTIERPRSLLLPGLVNAHTHLDLTHIGPREYDQRAGFAGFVETVRRERWTLAADIRRSVREGVALSLAGGVVAVGDIAGAPAGRPTLAAYFELASSALRGVSFVEFFAIGKGERPARERLTQVLSDAPDFGRGVQLGLQPHAPTTVALATYGWLRHQAGLASLPLSTHLAETAAEHEFIASGTGPHRRFLEDLGLWDDAMLEEIGRGRSPVAHMGEVLGQARFAAAHVNDASDADIELLASTKTSVVYCPRASEYFGAQEHFGPHRYREMLKAGINVALGTDSIINLPAEVDRLSPLDEARLLYRRDQTDPTLLLQMATTNGAKALGMNEAAFTLRPGAALAGLIAVPVDGRTDNPLADALLGTAAAELLAIGCGN
jgi:cytosine/adenosine deaminase-related metal-dependent hydrolase